jgi:hypothetical protein
MSLAVQDTVCCMETVFKQLMISRYHCNPAHEMLPFGFLHAAAFARLMTLYCCLASKWPRQAAAGMLGRCCFLVPTL